MNLTNLETFICLFGAIVALYADDSVSSVISGPHFSEYLYFTVTEECTVMLACKVNTLRTRPLCDCRSVRVPPSETCGCVCVSGGQREEGDDFPLVQRGRRDCPGDSSQRDVWSLRSAHPNGSCSQTHQH